MAEEGNAGEVEGKVAARGEMVVGRVVERALVGVMGAGAREEVGMKAGKVVEGVGVQGRVAGVGGKVASGDVRVVGAMGAGTEEETWVVVMVAAVKEVERGGEVGVGVGVGVKVTGEGVKLVGTEAGKGVEVRVAGKEAGVEMEAGAVVGVEVFPHPGCRGCRPLRYTSWFQRLPTPSAP